MKVLVVHSKEGKIVRLAIPNPACDRKVTPQLAKSQSVSEIEVPQLEFDSKDLDRRLAELATKFRVKSGPWGAQLVKGKKR